MYLLQMYLNCIPVLVSEGYKAPFIGFIKSGTCHVLRQVEVKGTLPNGAEVRMVIFVTFCTRNFISLVSNGGRGGLVYSMRDIGFL